MRLIYVFIFLILNFAVANDTKDVIQTTNEINQLVKTVGSPPLRSCDTIIKKDYGPDPRYITSLKNYPTPSKGCIPYETITDSQVTDLLSSQNLITVNASNRERKVLAAAILRIQQLNGGVLKEGVGPGSRPFPFKFFDENGSQQYANFIKIGRNKAKRGDKHYGHSVAQHVHEWAHLIGNQGGYQDFRSFMNKDNYGTKDYCMVSNYADNTPNEQFAEVLTAFVTEPKILLNNTRTPKVCKKVFEFFWQWFKKGEEVQTCL